MLQDIAIPVVIVLELLAHLKSLSVKLLFKLEPVFLLTLLLLSLFDLLLRHALVVCLPFPS